MGAVTNIQHHVTVSRLDALGGSFWKQERQAECTFRAQGTGEESDCCGSAHRSHPLNDLSQQSVNNLSLHSLVLQ